MLHEAGEARLDLLQRRAAALPSDVHVGDGAAGGDGELPRREPVAALEDARGPTRRQLRRPRREAGHDFRPLAHAGGVDARGVEARHELQEPAIDRPRAQAANTSCVSVRPATAQERQRRHLAMIAEHGDFDGVGLAEEPGDALVDAPQLRARHLVIRSTPVRRLVVGHEVHGHDGRLLLQIAHRVRHRKPSKNVARSTRMPSQYHSYAVVRCRRTKRTMLTTPRASSAGAARAARTSAVNTPSVYSTRGVRRPFASVNSAQAAPPASELKYEAVPCASDRSGGV